MLDRSSFSKVIIAYEPVWAIGTEETASPEQAQEMHAKIRTHLTSKYGSAAEETSILYGGSCKPDNAKEFQEKLLTFISLVEMVLIEV